MLQFVTRDTEPSRKGVFAISTTLLIQNLSSPSPLPSCLSSPVSSSIHVFFCPLLLLHPSLLSLFAPDSSDVLAVPRLVRPPLPAGVRSGAGRLRSVPVLPRARTAGCPQVEQQNSPASPAGGQRELQR